MKPMSKNGSSTGTAPKKASRRPRWLGPLLEDPMYRRMRKALIREIAPDTAFLAKGHLGTLPVGWNQARRQTSVATEVSIGP